uniref:Agenet-like domain-containing protein n=1 Tax=Plectus sambesii TaxID=2011161 RepID=A0A914UKF7_9BILA
MEIEVRLPNGGYYKAFVQSITADGLQVTFENEWQPSQVFPYDQCRMPPTNEGHQAFKEGEVAECLVKNQANEGFGWHQARIKQIKNYISLGTNEVLMILMMTAIHQGFLHRCRSQLCQFTRSRAFLHHVAPSTFRIGVNHLVGGRP